MSNQAEIEKLRLRVRRLEELVAEILYGKKNSALLEEPQISGAQQIEQSPPIDLMPKLTPKQTRIIEESAPKGLRDEDLEEIRESSRRTNAARDRAKTGPRRLYKD